MTPKAKILIVDDEAINRDSLGEWLSESGFEVYTAPDGASALELLDTVKIDAALTDLKMPGMDGVELLKRIKKKDPEMPVIIMTAFGTVSNAIEAMKNGAYDFLEKPFCPERVEITITNLIKHQEVLRECRHLKDELRSKTQFNELIGKSHTMHEVFELTRTVAKSNATVLILGETGTGKELVARAIHAESPRHNDPFVSLNCAALTETLLQSELFGHEKGSFTGAISAKKGKFEVANKGTLHLDEIGDISPAIQLYLLRVLQEKEFTRLGGNEVIKTDVRIIASTNRDLKKRVEEGLFREDLYYRLNVVPITVPPLRDRSEDIPVIARYFLKKFNTENAKELKDFAPEVMELFMRYAWPGNVRELENVVEHAVVLAQDESVRKYNLPVNFVTSMDAPAAGQDGEGGRTLKDVEKQHILKVLKDCDWNYSKAAQVIGVSRSTLYNKVKQYGIFKFE